MIRAFPFKYLFTFVYPIYDPSKHRFLRDIPRRTFIYSTSRGTCGLETSRWNLDSARNNPTTLFPAELLVSSCSRVRARARANSPPLLRTCYSARRGTLFQLAGSSAIWIILSRKERFLISNSPNVRCFCCTGRLARYLPRNASASAPRHFVNVPFPRGKVCESPPASIPRFPFSR